MRIITKEEWIKRILLPNQCSRPLKLSYDDWKDPSDPLGSLVEIIRFSLTSKAYQVLPSVFAGQVYLESDMGLKQDALLGVKATKSDYEKGTWKKMWTNEHFRKPEIERLERADEALSEVDKVKPIVVRETSPGSDVFIVKCRQDFHYEPGLQDDFERYFRYYERREPNRMEWFEKINSDPVKKAEDYLSNVTVGPPWKYATDVKYVSLVMSKIKKYELWRLDA